MLHNQHAYFFDIIFKILFKKLKIKVALNYCLVEHRRLSFIKSTHSARELNFNPSADFEKCHI